jgi:gamma-glutamyltranspeptidase
MVASPHAAASESGRDVLRAGGSAVDAALAAASALGVLYPHMCGIGGDAFWLIYDAAARKVSYLDGGGRAARGATLERFSGQAEIPFRGIVPATLTTPGAVASFCAAHERYGRLPLARCLQDAGLSSTADSGFVALAGHGHEQVITTESPLRALRRQTEPEVTRVEFTLLAEQSAPRVETPSNPQPPL